VPSLPTLRARGNYGENVAAAFLRRHGYRVLCRNFLVDQGEIDLVCRLGELLVFVEVRSRAGLVAGTPAESIDPRKQDALRAAAEVYLRLLGHPPVSYRFDAVEVVMQEGAIPACTLIADLFA